MAPAIVSDMHHGSMYDNNIIPLGGAARISEGLDDLAQLGKLSLDFGGYAVAVQSLDNTPPAVPGGCALGTTNEQFHLHWHAVRAADLWGYNVYRSLNGGPLLRMNEAIITDTSFDDATSHFGSAFSYRVTAVDTFGNESAGSVAVSVVAPPIFAPVGADPSLIGHWRFSAGSGTVLTDNSGHGNHGVIAGGVTWSPAGRAGSCLYFDGKSNAQAYIPDGAWNTPARRPLSPGIKSMARDRVRYSTIA